MRLVIVRHYACCERIAAFTIACSSRGYAAMQTAADAGEPYARRGYAGRDNAGRGNAGDGYAAPRYRVSRSVTGRGAIVSYSYINYRLQISTIA